LLHELREAAAAEAVAALLARRPADHVGVEDVYRVATLLHELREADDAGAAMRLAHRAACLVTLNEPRRAAFLLRTLREAGASAAIAELLARNLADHVILGDAEGVAQLLGELRQAGAQEAVAALLDRHPADRVTFRGHDRHAGFGALLRELREASAEREVTALIVRGVREHLMSADDQVLMEALREIGADVAASVPVDDLLMVGRTLSMLRMADASGAVSVLQARCPADHVAIRNGIGIWELLRSLHEVGATEAAAVLANRAAAEIPLRGPWDISLLLDALHEAGSDSAIGTLLARQPAHHVSVDEAWQIPHLLDALRKAGAGEAADALASRAAAQAGVKDPTGVVKLLRWLRKAEAKSQVTALAARAVPRTDINHFVRMDDLEPPWDPIDNFDGIPDLLRALEEAGEHEATTALATRAATHVALDDPSRISSLLRAMLEVGTTEAIGTLLARRPADYVRAHNAWRVVFLLTALHDAGDLDAVTALANRAATTSRVDHFVSSLMYGLRELRQRQALNTVCVRAADAGNFSDAVKENPDFSAKFEFGREPEGAPSTHWEWHDLDAG
jgi:hypothetical protein